MGQCGQSLQLQLSIRSRAVISRERLGEGSGFDAEKQIGQLIGLRIHPEQEAFRHKVRAWLEANLPPELCIDDPMDERIAPNREVFEKRRAWQQKLAAPDGSGSRGRRNTAAARPL